MIIDKSHTVTTNYNMQLLSNVTVDYYLDNNYDSDIKEYIVGNYLEVDKNEVRIFKTKNKNSIVLSELSKGSIVEVIRGEGKYYLIRYSNGEVLVEGYIYSKYLKGL
jgi:hypothetical protein